MLSKPKIKCITYGGVIGWFLRKHFSWITSDAYILWQYHSRKHLFKKYIDNFIQKSEKGIISQPCLISIETINRCNSLCAFCPANRSAEKRPFKKMDEVLFYKIIDDLKEMDYSGYLNLYVNNEPFIDTRIEDWYIYAHEQLPKAKMLLYTNGTLLTKERFKKIIPVIDMCFINNYSENMKLHENLKELIVYIKNNEEYWDKDITIQIRYINEILTNRSGVAPNKKKEMKGHMVCIMPYTDMTIYPDGTVGLCCNDALEKTNYGNLYNDTLQNIWTSEVYQLLRKVIGKDRSLYPFCKGCDFVDAGIRNDFIKKRLSEK